MAVRLLIPTEEEIAATIEHYVRSWLVEFVQSDVETQALTVAALREHGCECPFHSAFLDALAEFGERLRRVRPMEEGT